MEIYMVGVFKSGKKAINGFKMLGVNDDGTTEIKDVSYQNALNVLASGIASIHNLKLVNGEIKGDNGSLDRYGVIGKSQSLVILKECLDNTGKFCGYFCSDAMGNTKLLSEQETLRFASGIGIANGKVVNDSNGGKHISSIDGTYPIMRISKFNRETPKQAEAKPKQTEVKPVENKVEKPAEISKPKDGTDSPLYKEAIELLDKMRSHPKFNSSFAKKIGISVLKYKKCSEKQLNYIRRDYKDMFGDKPATEEKAEAPETTKPVEEKKEAKPVVKEEDSKPKSVGTPVINKPTPATTSAPVMEPYTSPSIKNKPKKDRLIIEQPKTDSDNILVYQLMDNNKVYVKGLVDIEKSHIDIVIPKEAVLNGKSYAITGILNNAFSGTMITSFKAFGNITDIGQAAFANCLSLEVVDLSETNINHVSMNMFKGCVKLNNVQLNNKVERIHEAAFTQCVMLDAIELPDSADTIARNAFLGCKNLYYIKHNVKNINDSAFRDCLRLKEFDFSSVTNIGAYAFRNTGFEHLVIPGNVVTVGNKAFADCLLLEDVKILEGVKELGEYCFAKSRKVDVYRQYRKEVDYTEIKEITTAKSIISVLTGAFLHVELVKVWTGSACESHCIGFNVPYVQLDSSDLQNSTRVRIKSEMLSVNPIEEMNRLLDTPKENASNPAVELNTKKLVNIPFTESQFTFLGIKKTTEQVEPTVKFKAAVNYLQDVSDLYQKPLANGVLRLQSTFYVKSDTIFDDGCNRIYKVTYTIMDTLESGSFIIVFMDNNLKYVAECNLYTNITMENSFDTDDNVPVKTFLHAGDAIGRQSTISGHSCILTDESTLRRINVGDKLLKRLFKHGITIETAKKDSMLYLPSANCTLKLHDGRVWDRPGVISRESKDCINVLAVLEYADMIKELKAIKKANYNESKLFDELEKLPASVVAKRTKDIVTIEEEKEAQLFQVSKQFREVVQNAKVNQVSINPNLVTLDVFKELARSYWMISKDSYWLSSVGKKSLNKTNEYTIGNCKLTEYKSNQIVKFSNPYMNGKKGAYVFILTKNGAECGVYASRYSLATIISMLYSLTDMSQIPDDYEVPVLMQSAENFDKVVPELFFNFYDVLQSKNGWGFETRSAYRGYGVSFHIAMYKPTGIFYLTMSKMSITERTKLDDTKEKVTKELRVIPLLPIGNMDRALLSADTTNVNAKDSRLLKELVSIMTLEELKDGNISLYNIPHRDVMNSIKENYIKARQLIIDGVKDVDKYKALIDDRAVYMLGTVHKGTLQREFGAEPDVDDEDNLDLELDLSEFNNVPDESDDIEDDMGLDLSDFEADGLEDEDADESDEITFEDFFETAKSMGITDESQARAMFAGFLANQNK